MLDAVSFVVTAALHASRCRPSTTSAPRAGEPKLAVLRDRPYALVTLLNAILLLRMPLLSVAIPLWIVERTAAPGWTVSALFVLNTVVVVLLQVRVAGRLASIGAAARMVRRSGLLLFASCVAFALSALGTSPWIAFAVLVAGALVQVLGEMLQSAGSLGDRLRARAGRPAGAVPGVLRHRDVGGAGDRPGAAEHRRHRLGPARLAAAWAPFSSARAGRWARGALGYDFSCRALSPYCAILR